MPGIRSYEEQQESLRPLGNDGRPNKILSELNDNQEYEMKANRDLHEALLELASLESKRSRTSGKARKIMNTLPWGILALMSVQFAIFARLTWWEYSWEIMEPFAYFISYATGMISYAHFAINKRIQEFSDTEDVLYKLFFRKYAKKYGFNTDVYDVLRRRVNSLQADYDANEKSKKHTQTTETEK